MTTRRRRRGGPTSAAAISASTSWVKTRTRVDGLGRPLSETRFRQIIGEPDEVTSYLYDSAGRLERIVRPDPTVDTGSAVDAAIFRYDAIDRPTRVTRPLGAQLEKTYAGLRTTLTEVTTDGSGSTTHFDSDVFGQLRKVTEVDGTTNAVTTYGYDGNGNLREVVDADGNVTTLAHDWAGNRLSITRGTRTWAYSYDLNGNMRSELPPRPDGTAAADYTNQMVYDDLDRVRQRVPAPRGLSPSRRAQLGIGTITFHYDGTAGPVTNAKGRLSKVVHAVDDPATTAIEALDNDYWYYARGIIQKEQRRVVASYLRSTSATQWVERTYNALNLETQATFDDGSTYTTSYDLRGLVAKLDWRQNVTLAWFKVAEYVYSLAGQPRARLTGFGQDKQTTYDVLGRAYDEEVRDLSPLTTRAHRRYTFDEAGNITRSDFINPALSGAWVYQYDRRHRLRSATAPGYTGAFNYSLAGNITTANVTGPVHPRNVTYGYGAVDPQAVDTLTSSGGASYASFSYDRAGNTTRRVTPDGTWDLEWDGEDQLRESVGGGKREAYWYDHEGQRALAILQDGTTTEARFWFDLSETTFSTTSKRWLYLPGARVENGTSIELNYADHVSSAEVTLDTSGVPVTAFVYTPWGEPLASMGTTSTHRRRFNDKDNDAATGLSYYGFRYYDPLTARWASADPLYRFAPDFDADTPEHANLYAFSLSNPVSLLDPNGLSASDGFIEGWCTGDLFCNQPADEQDPFRHSKKKVAASTVDDKAQEKKADKAGEDDDKRSPPIATIKCPKDNPNCVSPLDVPFGPGMVVKPVQGVVGLAARLLGRTTARTVARAFLPRVKNGAEHVFGSNLAKHRMEGVLKTFGGNKVAAFMQLENVAQSLADNGTLGPGVTDITVHFVGETITMRVMVMFGEARVSTAFVKGAAK